MLTLRSIVIVVLAWTKELLPWLETYTFPEEAKFSDPDYARLGIWRLCPGFMAQWDY